MSSGPVMPASALRASLELANIGLLDYPHARIELQAQTDDLARKIGQPDRQWRRLAVAKEPFTTAFIEAIPAGGVFYDIGANVGSYTLIAAVRGIPTVAIEPASSNQHALWMNLALNHQLARVARVQAALGTVNGWAWIGYRDMQSGSADFIIGDDKQLFQHRLEVIHQERIRLWRLDDLVAVYGLPAPTHLKLDVDGAELAVLQGAERLLTEGQAVGLMVELQPETAEDITKYLTELGWKQVERWDVRGIAYAQWGREPKKPARRVRKKAA